MKIAVTGGAGFIGQAVVRQAADREHEVWAFDRSHGDDIRGPLNKLSGADAVIHLAGVLGTAELFDEAELAVEVNVLGSLRIMQWCVEHGAQYVGILMPDVFPSIYTATKVATQRLATALHHSRGLKVNHVRAYNAFGPGQKYGKGHPQKIVPTFAVHAWHRKPIPIWGDGSQGVDLIHTGDLARMLVDAAERPGVDQVFDGGTGVEMTVLQVARMIARHTQWEEPEFQFLPMRDGERATTGIQAKGEGWATLGWHPPVRSLAHTVLSYKGVELEGAAGADEVGG